MLKNAILALAAVSMVATPTVASATDHGQKSWKKAQKRAQRARYYNSTAYYAPVRTRYVTRTYARPYYGTRYVSSRYYGGSPYYGGSYYGGSPYYGSYYGGSPYYGGYGSYAQPYYGSYYGGSPYYGRSYYGSRYRCGNGTTGALVGGALGAVVGSQVATSRNRYGYRSGDRTTGALIGGALGAVVGSQVARGNC